MAEIEGICIRMAHAKFETNRVINKEVVRSTNMQVLYRKLSNFQGQITQQGKT